MAYTSNKSVIPLNLQSTFEAAAHESQDRLGYTRNKRYAYIRYDLPRFEQMMKPHLKPGMHVVDVGCGAGDKLMAYHLLCRDLKITGIEFDKILAKKAVELCPFANIIRGDARRQHYGDYDLIYMYRPMPDEKLHAALQEQVMRTMKIGARLIVALQARDNKRNGRHFPFMGESWRNNVCYANGWVKRKRYHESQFLSIALAKQYALGG